VKGEKREAEVEGGRRKSSKLMYAMPEIFLAINGSGLFFCEKVSCNSRSIDIQHLK